VHWEALVIVARLRIALLVVVLCAPAACDDDDDAVDTDLFPPSAATLLSTNSPTKDEDPSVLRARDGTMYVAWFSDRGGNPDIYIASSARGSEWTTPVRVTTHTGGDFNPSLFQDEQGVFHLVWFRWTAPFRGNIWYNSSPDGRTWNPAAEVQVTRAFDVDDWVPTLTNAADGSLLVYFVSDLRDGTNPSNDIYLARRRPGETQWDAVVPIPGINSATEHDHLPFAMRTGSQITLVWVRHDLTEALPWINPKSSLIYANSTNGINFSTPVRITNDNGNIVNLFPGIFVNFNDAWSLVWLSTRAGPPRVYELPLANANAFPQGIAENTQVSPGYSHRIARTPTAGVYLGVWVQGPEGAQDIYYRFFRK
jgi:hypothetical protein